MIAEALRHIRKLPPRTSDHVVVGKVVRVTDRIPPGRLGAVLVPIRGGTEEFYARSGSLNTIPVGEMVEVVAYAPPRTVDVKPIGRPTLTKTPTPEL